MARHNARHNKRKEAAAQSGSAKGGNRRKVSAAETEQFCRKIKTFLKQARNRAMSEAALAQKCHSRHNPAAFQAALEKLLYQGELTERRGGYRLNDSSECFHATTLRLARSFGFIRDEEGVEHFVPGKFLRGSMPGDIVLARPIESRTGSPEAEVLSILKESPNPQLTGVIIATEEGLQLLPDTMSSTPLRIEYRSSVEYTIGDKVLAVLTQRGERHMEHRVRVMLNFGSAESAENCMAARIMEQGVPVEFPEPVLRDAKKAKLAGITEFDIQDREDFRDECIFTIDGAHSKDLDDAVSVRRTENGWELGVHIADVSHYVRPNSPLDGEAFERGTSIYYADKVIPMLPPDLSNGICSLNGGETRLAISAVMQISEEGDLLASRFCKSVICSKVRGIYSECNAVLDGSADAETAEKYAAVTESLKELDRLAQALEHRRIRRGAPTLESTESGLLLNEDGICTGLVPLQRGRSEEIIEACMLAANEAVARLAREEEIPLVYRIHEEPSPERLAQLRETMEKLGAEPPKFSAKPAPSEIQKLLDSTREEAYFPILNSMTLRSMAKARYSHEGTGHFGLALRDYAHFTSPIRRYPDLVVHRILSDYLDGADKAWLKTRYSRFTENAAARSSDMEVRAVALERTAQSCYAAEYMQAHIGEDFRGIISGVTEHGIYVVLENLVEVMVHMEDLPEGTYEFEPDWYVKSDTHKFTIGDPITITCLNADINSGKILASGVPHRRAAGGDSHS